LSQQEPKPTIGVVIGKEALEDQNCKRLGKRIIVAKDL
jgi:hypothetical protein